MQQMRVFYTTLMMVLCVHKERTKLELDWTELKDFYEDFLFGDTIMKRNNPPTLARLMVAERRAWQAIITLMWEKAMKLGDALRKVQNNVLWWTNELEIKKDEAPRQKSSQKGSPPRPQQQMGKGKGGYQSQPKKTQSAQLKHDGHQSPTGKSTKGKGKRNGRNEAAGKNPKRSLPSGLADGMRLPPDLWGDPPTKREWCNNFHSGRACSGQCNRDHTCPACRKGIHPLSECWSI
jgi:hypothetical protein